MWKTVLVAALAAGLVGTPAALAMSPVRLAEAAAPKQLTPQQQKMKDCAAKWKEAKATTSAKDRPSYRKFMSDCLKKAAA